MMKKSILNWLQKNITGYEIKNTQDGGIIIYIPIYREYRLQENKAKKYFKNKGQIKYIANYTSLVILL